MEDYLNLYVSILSKKIGRNLTEELHLYIIFIYKEIYINMKEHHKKEGKNEEELKSDINKIFREAISEQNEGEYLKILKRLITSLNNILYEKDNDKYKNLKISNFEEIRRFFSKHHAKYFFKDFIIVLSWNKN